MANQIRITPDTLRLRAQQYHEEADQLNNTLNRINQLFDQLQNEWEGEASQIFAARFAELQPSFIEAERLFREIAQSMESTSQAMEESDAGIANMFR